MGLPVRVMATSDMQRRWCWKTVLAAFWEDRAAVGNEAIISVEWAMARRAVLVQLASDLRRLQGIPSCLELQLTTTKQWIHIGQSSQ
jgi:hypothetical protein